MIQRLLGDFHRHGLTSREQKGQGLLWYGLDPWNLWWLAESPPLCMVPDRQNLDQNNPEQQPNVSLNNNSDQCLSSITLLFWCQGIKDWRRFFNKAFGYSVHPLVSLSILYEGPPRWSLTSHYQIWLSTAAYVGFNHVRPIRTCQAPYIGPTQAFVIW